jgi:organic hydroperoxide reductase OsmC/OhrA
MAEHRMALSWSRNGAAFTASDYPRDLQLSFPDGPTVPGGPAPEFGGTPGRVDPEQALVAALSSCHALTFLALAAKRKLVVDSYEDDAAGTLGKNEDGKMWLAEVRLQPRVQFTPPLDGAALAQLHEQAHRYCFIANSVKTKVLVEPRD